MNARSVSKIHSASLVMLLVMVGLVGFTAGPATAEDYLETYDDATAESATDNQAFVDSDGDGSLLCTVAPFDGATGTFRGAGGGTSEALVGSDGVESQDFAAFLASCIGVDADPFTLTVDYEFEWRAPDGTWSAIPGSQVSCSAQSEPSTTTLKIAALVPASPGCSLTFSYRGDDDWWATIHRLHIRLSTTAGNVVEGVSVPWITPDALPPGELGEFSAIHQEGLDTSYELLLDSAVEIDGIQPLGLTELMSDTVTCNGYPVTIKSTTNGNDYRVGYSTRDVINGLGGRDHLDMQGGHDEICGGNDRDDLYGRSGQDNLFGGGNGGDSGEFLNGGDAADDLYGGSGADDLRGEKGVDRVYGQDGADWGADGSGDDYLSGGAGYDQLFLCPDGYADEHHGWEWVENTGDAC